MTRPENVAEHNAAQLASLLDSFSEADPSFSWIGTDNTQTREAVIEAVVENLPDYQHVVLDVGSEKVSSLKAILDSRFADVLGEESSRGEPRIIHILNLSHTLFREIMDQEEVLVEGLSNEWAALTGEYPFVMIGWLDGHLWNQLSKAGGVMWAEPIPKTQFFAEGGEEKEAAADYEELKALVGEEADYPTLLSRGEILCRNHVWDLAMEHFEKVLENEEAEADQIRVASAGMGEVYAAEGDQNAAIEAFDQAIEAAEEDDAANLATYYQRKGDIYNRMRYTDETVTAYQKALKQFKVAGEKIPTDMMGYLALALERQGKLDKAVAVYEAIIEQYGMEEELPHYRMALAYQQIGAIRQNQQRYADALIGFQKGQESAEQTDDEFLLHALEDSVENMMDLLEEDPQKTEESKKKKKKGFFGRLLG